jgi:ATP-dependent RNA helicase DDX52/ROK1
MKQSGCQLPAWMDNLPKLTKRDKRRIKQKLVQRKDIDAETKVEKQKKAHKR